jgi:hypothetical protein
MNRLSPRTTVLSGATIGLIAGVAIYGAVSSSATAKVPTAVQPASANVAVAPANAAQCAAGQQLEDGVCVVHIERTVVIPAAPSSVSSLSAGPSSSGNGAVEPSEQVAAGTETDTESEAAEPADDAAEHAPDVAEHAPDVAEHAPDVAEHAAENDG